MATMSVSYSVSICTGSKSCERTCSGNMERVPPEADTFADPLLPPLQLTLAPTEQEATKCAWFRDRNLACCDATMCVSYSVSIRSGSKSCEGTCSGIRSSATRSRNVYRSIASTVATYISSHGTRSNKCAWVQKS